MNRLTQRGMRWLRMLGIAVAAALIFWTIVFMLFEDKFIYFPDRYPKGAYDQARSIPNLRDCWITAEDGVKLHGWFAPAESAKATLVISHGNAGNISHRYLLMRSLLRHKFNVLMYDYRGYGRSEGTPSEEGVYIDGRAFFDYALTLPEVNPQRVILWGTSLGGAVATDVATQRPAAGLILESTFTSGKDVTRILYPFLPVQFFLRSKFNSIEKIRTLSIPTLIMHGEHDSIIPPGLGRKLFNAANEPKEFYEIPGADHNDTFFVGGDEYFNRIDQFVTKALATTSRRAH
ncbi:MAG: alpha/beta hydrolase [Ignavibacteria bacterium]|nr:alpha/beta hydrolase [Ignavibacteria bacterium]